MNQPTESTTGRQPLRRIAALAVHAYTASGVLLAVLAVAELLAPAPDPRWVFLWLLAAVWVDATDGLLARRLQVKRYAPEIDGRKIDDIVDYLTFTFVPLLLAWRLQWLPEPALVWIMPALVASLFGFANVDAKYERQGFFRGFPSYWNVFAFYAGLWATHQGPLGAGLLLLALSLMTLLPVRFLYPTHAPRPWRHPLVVGGALWTLLLLAMLPTYPHTPLWLVGLSLVYPAFYTGLSLALAR